MHMHTDRKEPGGASGKGRPRTSKHKEGVLTILRTADSISRMLTVVLEPYDITLQQFNVLRILRGSGAPIPTMVISERMIEATPGITRLLDRLEQKGLVARSRHTADRRQVLCKITEAGLKLLEDVDRPIIECERQIMRALATSELSHLITLLNKVRSPL